MTNSLYSVRGHKLIKMQAVLSSNFMFSSTDMGVYGGHVHA